MTTPFIQVVDAVRELLEPTIPGDWTRAQSGIAVDVTAARPFEYEAETLYAWEDSSAHVSIGTGEVREDFTIVVVYAASGNGEESTLKRSRATSEALDARRTAYLDKLRHAPGRAGVWDYLLGASVPEFLRQFETRGVAIRVTGYRLVTD